MSLERALVPLAIAIAVIALAVMLMLVNDVGPAPWILAALVFAHGWVHLLFVFPKPNSPNGGSSRTSYPFDFARSWLVVGRSTALRPVRRMGLVLMAATFVLSVLAALATAGILVPADWWAALMVAAAATSTVMLLLFYSPALILGFANNALMVALVLSGTWSPA